MENQTYCKYEFSELPDLSNIDGDVVINAPFNIKDAVIDEQGEILEPAIKGTKIPVDILYIEEPDPSLEPFKVTPKKPKATILGRDEEYFKTLSDA